MSNAMVTNLRAGSIPDPAVDPATLYRALELLAAVCHPHHRKELEAISLFIDEVASNLATTDRATIAGSSSPTLAHPLPTMDAPWRDASVTPGCLACGDPLPVGRARRWCSDACRQAGFRRRHQRGLSPEPSLPVARSSKAVTVYECPACEARLVGDQHCGDCGTFMRKVGPGGLCPHCDEPLSLEELFDGGPR